MMPCLRGTSGDTGANVDDRDVGRFLRLFADLPLDETRPASMRSAAAKSTRPRSCWPTK
jgi:hypothetical protein